MINPVAKQDKLNRLYAQILNIDEDGKDFLEKIVTEAAASRNFPPVKRLPGENRPKTEIEP
jgi:hypothetical protein